MRIILNKLKPLFKIPLRSLEDFICIILGLLVFAVVIFHACFLEITYDEAYTYLNTGRIQDVWKIVLFRIANTHILNSLLMSVSTLLVPYSDFALRLPSVLFALIYLIVANNFSKQYQNRLIMFGLLTLFYFLIFFMSIGRGYGMCACLLLITLFIYKNKVQYPKFHLWIAYFLLLAVYANFVAIPIAFVMLLFIFIVDLQLKFPQVSKNHIIIIASLFSISLYGFYSVTRAGKPLFGAYDQSFFKAIPIDFVSRFWAASIPSEQLISITSVITALLLVTLFLLKQKNSKIGIITVLIFSIVAFVAWIGEKPLPTERVLLPFWPFVVLSVIGILDTVIEKGKIPRIVVRLLNIAILLMLTYNFNAQIDFKEIKKAHDSHWKIPTKWLSNYGSKPEPQGQYYIEKDRYHCIIPKKMASINNLNIDKNPYHQSAEIPRLQAALITLPEKKEDQKIFREVIAHNEVIYKDTLRINDIQYRSSDACQFLIAFSNFRGTELRIGDLSGQWQQNYILSK